MKIDNKEYCNVCLKESNKDENTVYMRAVCRGEDIHICTSCVPHVIHGSGDIVKSNAEVEKEIRG